MGDSLILFTLLLIGHIFIVVFRDVNLHGTIPKSYWKPFLSFLITFLILVPGMIFGCEDERRIEPVFLFIVTLLFLNIPVSIALIIYTRGGQMVRL